MDELNYVKKAMSALAKRLGRNSCSIRLPVAT